MTCTIVTGARDAGKTRRCLDIYNLADGTCAIKTFSKDLHTGYDAFRPRTGESVPLLGEFQDNMRCNGTRVGRFCMYQDGLERSISWIREGLQSNVVIIDEVGRLELAGGGYADTIRYIVSCSYRGNLVLGIRDIYVQDVVRAFELPDPSEIIEVV